jgi:hypothetical protein
LPGENELDLTQEPVPADSDADQPPTLEPYDAGANGTDAPEELDLTDETVPASTEADKPPDAKPYDLVKERESMRGRVAGALLVILAFIVIGAFFSLWFNWAKEEELKTVLTILFGPVIGLVGAATGFYFGSDVARS